MTIDRNDSDVIWVGNGENVSGRHVGYGSGVFSSRDGGKTFTTMRADSRHADHHASTTRRDQRLVAAENYL